MKSIYKDKIPSDVYFNIPFVASEQVQSYIKALDTSRATGQDGLGPKIFELAINSLSPKIAILINKSIRTRQFPNAMKCAKVFPIFTGGNKSDASNYWPISYYQPYQKIFERHVNKHLTNYLLNTSLFVNINQAVVKSIAARLHWSNFFFVIYFLFRITSVQYMYHNLSITISNDGAIFYQKREPT